MIIGRRKHKLFRDFHWSTKRFDKKNCTVDLSVKKLNIIWNIIPICCVIPFWIKIEIIVNLTKSNICYPILSVRGGKIDTGKVVNLQLVICQKLGFSGSYSRSSQISWWNINCSEQSFIWRTGKIRDQKWDNVKIRETVYLLTNRKWTS